MISWIGWHDNGKKAGEENYQNGQSYRKYWNEKGEIVSSLGEALGSVSYDEGSFNNEGIYYVKNSDIPYTGFAHSYNNKRQVILTVRLKEGKKTQEMKRHLNGKQCFIKKYKDGILISEKFWNSKGESVDSEEEATAE